MNTQDKYCKTCGEQIKFKCKCGCREYACIDCYGTGYIIEPCHCIANPLRESDLKAREKRR